MLNLQVLHEAADANTDEYANMQPAAFVCDWQCMPLCQLRNHSAAFSQTDGFSSLQGWSFQHLAPVNTKTQKPVSAAPTKTSNFNETALIAKGSNLPMKIKNKIIKLKDFFLKNTSQQSCITTNLITGDFNG